MKIIPHSLGALLERSDVCVRADCNSQVVVVFFDSLYCSSRLLESVSNCRMCFSVLFEVFVRALYNSLQHIYIYVGHAFACVCGGSSGIIIELELTP